MKVYGGRSLRVELYGLALAGAFVFALLYDRMRLQEALLREVIKQLPQRIVVQQNNNNQSVIVEVEAESDRLAREIAIKRGWIDVDGNNRANSNANGTSTGGPNMPADRK
jgi:hypothetical protein